MKYEIRFTSRFKKDVKLARKQHKNLEMMYQIIETLANGDKLDDKYRDHDLSGNYAGCRECHIEPDWIMIYEIVDSVLVLSLNRVGSHSDLFK